MLTSKKKGTDEYYLYSEDQEMALAAIRSKYNYVGIAAGEYQHGVHSIDQGFPVAFGGTFTVPIMTGEKFEPGQIVRAELAIPDKSYVTNGKFSKSHFDLASYPWRLVPEDYTSPGTLLHKHFTAILEDDQKWKKCVSVAGSNLPDRWLTFANAKTNSTLMTVLLGIYPMLKMNLFRVDGTPIQNPYIDKSQQTENGGLDDKMQADEVIIRLAQLFGIIETTVYDDIPSNQKNWFMTLARIIMMTVHFDPKNRTMEFGQRQKNVSTTTRNSKTGKVQTLSPAGEFLNKQINHDRILTGATLQALDDHVKNRVGRVICGPNRTVNVDIVMEKSNL